MDGQIAIKDLLFFTIFCLVIVAGIFLVILIYKLTQFIKRATYMLETNSENIQKTLELLPQTTQNVNDIAIAVKTNIEKVENAVGGVEEAVAETVAAVSESTENVMNFIKIITEIISIVLGSFSSKKK